MRKNLILIGSNSLLYRQIKSDIEHRYENIFRFDKTKVISKNKEPNQALDFTNVKIKFNFSDPNIHHDVFILAAHTAGSPKIDDNVKILENSLEWLGKLKNLRIFFFSSALCEIYEKIYKINPEMANKMTYAKSKTKCENILRNKVKCENISLRIPYVIFPQRTGIFKFAKKVSNTFGLPIPFNKNNYFPYCNSSELSDLICFLLDDSLTKGTNRNKVVNCWNSSNVTIEGLVSAYGKELNPIWISSQIGVRVLWFLSKLKFIPFCEEQIIPFIEISSHK